ncbi:MAG TPA: DNA double-strand break repair nuclease NurA [Chloroflexota bacterium]|nr:DNA double-strand break repair nuclease NurA [Chloroflexota bacterium]
MFVPERAGQALAAQADAFRRVADESAQLLSRYEAALRALARMTAVQIDDRLGGVPWPGARPTVELDRRGLIIPFGITWQSAEEARRWALAALSGIPTAAVDGSQIPASKEFGVPVSLIQVAWFVNEHDAGRPYIKDVRDEVVTPENDDYLYADAALSRRRFALEMTAAVEQLHSLAGREHALLFVDGTFVLSFAGRLAPEARTGYLDALFDLLDTSERVQVPVVGYVDLSLASDLAGLLAQACDLPAGSVFDGQILARSMRPFDRTAVFQCARGDVLPYYRRDDSDRSGDLCFTYLQIGHDTLPVRLDLPRWVVESGRVDEVVDIIRAEIVVGTGYPYALETADAAAVLTTDDRLTFYRLYHEFAQRSGLNASVPAKSVSKARRR